MLAKSKCSGGFTEVERGSIFRFQKDKNTHKSSHVEKAVIHEEEKDKTTGRMTMNSISYLTIVFVSYPI